MSRQAALGLLMNLPRMTTVSLTALKKLAAAAKSGGAPAILQIFHA